MQTYKPEGSLFNTEENREYIRSKDGLLEAMKKRATVEAKVILCDHSMSLHVALGDGVRGVIPKDEAAFSSTGEQIKDIAILTRVGKTVAFKVQSISQKGSLTEAMLSRREAQQECYENYISRLRPGDVIPALVTHTESFGAFLDIGVGTPALLSIDRISVSRISHPKERLSVGDRIFTVVKSKDDLGRIFTSERELLGSWEENAGRFTEGETVRGIVRSVESYGIFVELRPNLAGLAEPRDGVLPGQSAAVYIKSIIPEKMKIKLIIIDSHSATPDKTPLEYFIDTEKTERIESWLYSPPSSKRIIETVF